MRVSQRILATSAFACVLIITVLACGGETTTSKKSNASGAGAAGVEVTLTFDAYEDAAAAGFRVMARLASSDASKVVAEVARGKLDLKKPAVTLTPAQNKDLADFIGKKTCFTVRAFNEDGSSKGSNEVCVDL
jgi:hypothetical protein